MTTTQYGHNWFGLSTYETVRGRTWSLVHTATGMEVAVVTGKRRMKALRAHLAAQECSTWQDWWLAAREWKLAHPRKAVA